MFGVGGVSDFTIISPIFWEIGCHFPFPFPFPNVGNSISNSRSRSQMLGTVFQIPVPVPECWEQYVQFPFLNAQKSFPLMPVP